MPDATAPPSPLAMSGEEMGVAAPESVAELRVPGETRYLAVLRHLAQCCGTALGLPAEEVEDLRLAVDELGAVVVGEAHAGAGLHVVLRADGDDLYVRLGTVRDPASDVPVLPELSALLLRHVGGSYAFEPDGALLVAVLQRPLRG